MLDKKQRKFLKAQANELSAIVIIGKEGITENVIASLKDALAAHELVKVSLLKTVDQDVHAAALDLASATHSEVVQTIGRVIVLYKRSKKNKMGL